MPYCTNCGEEVTEEQRYCSYCGEWVGDGEPERQDHERATSQPSAGGERAGEQPSRSPGGAGSGRTGSAGSRRAEGERPGRAGAGTDQPAAAGQQRYGDHPDPEMLPKRGTFQMYYDGVRESVGLPAVLVLLAIAWGLTAIPPAVPTAAGVVTVIASVVLGLFGAGIAFIATDYQYRDGDVTTAEAAKQILDRAVPLTALWFIFAVVFSIGLSLFVIPGLYLGGRLLLAFPACVLDGEGTIDSLSTSWELTSGESLKPMGFLFAAIVTTFAISLVLAIPQNLVFTALDLGVSDAQTVDELVDLAADPQFAVVNGIFTGLTLAVPVAAVQIAAAKMYLENRYGVREKLA